MFFPMCSFLRDQFYGDTALPIVWSLLLLLLPTLTSPCECLCIWVRFCVCVCVCVCVHACLHSCTYVFGHFALSYTKQMWEQCLLFQQVNAEIWTRWWLSVGMTARQDDCQSWWLSDRMAVRIYVYLLVLVLKNQNFEKKIQHSVITTVHACSGDVLVGLHIYHHFLLLFCRCKSFVPLF